jgi:hypothetical protein
VQDTLKRTAGDSQCAAHRATRPSRSGRVVVLDRSTLQYCIPASPWSHLWSHSRRFRGVRTGLPSLGSGATRPNRTCLNHQPQNSKAREGQPSAGSNPAATASLTRPNAGRAATWAPAFFAVVSNVVSIGPDWCVSAGPQEAVEATGQITVDRRDYVRVAARLG